MRNYLNRLKAQELLDSCYNPDIKGYLIPQTTRDEIISLLGEIPDNIKFMPNSYFSEDDIRLGFIQGGNRLDKIKSARRSV